MDVLWVSDGTPGQVASRAIGTLFVAFLAYRFWIVVYNLYWHPLSRFPGPAIRAAFDFPDSVCSLRGIQYLEVQALHEKYGHVVRLSPDTLSYTDPQAWKDIYALKPDRSELHKDPRMYNMMPTTHIINAKQAEHARYRKLIAPVFNDTTVYAQEPLLQSYLDLFVSKLNENIDGEAQGRVDIRAQFIFLTFDIIGELVLGEPFGALKQGELVPYIRNVFESIRVLGLMKFASKHPIIKIVLGIILKLNPSFFARRKAHMAFTADKVDKRLEQPTGRLDFIGHVTRNKSDALSHLEILRNSRILLTAGSETSATHLSGAVWLLLRNPEKLQKVQAEVRSAFGIEEKITLRSVMSAERLPYLNAVISESFRLYPSTPAILPRETRPEGNIILGQFVGGKMSVGVHHWAAYRHPGNFHKPSQFIPERWLPDRPAEFKNDRREVLQPFSTGPRGCLGKSLAYAEIRSTLVRMFLYYEMQLEDESFDWLSEQREYTLWDKPALWIKLSHRKT